MSSPVYPLLETPLAAAHADAGARMVPFAGYAMPLQYPDGVIAEHRWTRAHAGLFDVSHMGAALLHLANPSGDPERDHVAIASLLERRLCGDLQGLRPGALRYALILNDDGGALDDVIVGRPADPALQGSLSLVANAATKDADFALLTAELGEAVRIERFDDHALIALQGPEAAEVLEAQCPGISRLGFMSAMTTRWAGAPLLISRSGYTGEDGFEILLPADAGRSLWAALIADARVRPVGLAARDSLRLEAGLPLYGHELDPGISPVEAGLRFALSLRRLERGGPPGQARLARELSDGPARIRVGLRVLEGAPAREGAPILHEGRQVGIVTSGGFSPTLSAPIAMGFVPPALAAPGTSLAVEVRTRAQPAQVVPLPFVPHRYVRQSSKGAS